MYKQRTEQLFVKTGHGYTAMCVSKERSRAVL